MQRRSFMALAGSGLVCGCGAVHQLPAVSDGNIATAQAEVRMAPPPLRRWVSEDEVARTLRAAIQSVRAPAANLCHEMAVGVCDWSFQYVTRPRAERRRHGIRPDRAQSRHRRVCRQRRGSLPGGGPRDRPPRREPHRQGHGQPDDRRPDRRRGGEPRRRRRREQSRLRRNAVGSPARRHGRPSFLFQGAGARGRLHGRADPVSGRHRPRQGARPAGDHGGRLAPQGDHLPGQPSRGT